MLDIATYYAFNLFGVDFVVGHGYILNEYEECKNSNHDCKECNCVSDRCKKASNNLKGVTRKCRMQKSRNGSEFKVIKLS